MATFTDRIHILKSGAEQTALIYSTTGESGTPNLPVIVAGQQGYAALLQTSDARATAGRVTSPVGDVYAIGTEGSIPYNYTRYTSGSGSFTVPTGVTKLRVTCIGGGAGGCVCHRSAFSKPGSGKAGGKTTFGSVSANGATAASYNAKYIDDGENYPTYSITGGNVSQGTTNGAYYGISGDNNKYSGAPAISLTGFDGVSYGSYGAGGYADADKNNGMIYLLTGASGYKTASIISVTPGQVLSYSVGGGGQGAVTTQAKSTAYYSSDYSSNGFGAGVGKAGAILVEWGNGIQ